MPLYRFGPLVIESDVPLPELPVVQDTVEPDCQFWVELASAAPVEDIPWYHHHLFPDGEIGISLGKNDLGFLMRFDETIDFHVSPDGSKIRCLLSKLDLGPDIRHRLLNHVLPLSLSLRGFLTLHAGAVRVPQGAIAFLGRTGAGKSTLTAAFLAQGFDLITEDCLILKEEGNRLMAIPTYPILRMRPETWHYFKNDRRFIPASCPEPEPTPATQTRTLVGQSMGVRMAAEPVPFVRLYLLDPEADRLEIKLSSPREAFLSVVQHSFLLDLVSRNTLTERFHHSALLMGAKTWRLRIPRRLQELPLAVDSILEHLRSNPCEE